MTHVAPRSRGSAPIRGLVKSGHPGEGRGETSSYSNFHSLELSTATRENLAPQLQNPFLSFGRFLSSALLSHPFPSILYPIRQPHPSNFIKMADDAQVSKLPV